MNKDALLRYRTLDKTLHILNSELVCPYTTCQPSFKKTLWQTNSDAPLPKKLTGHHIIGSDVFRNCGLEKILKTYPYIQSIVMARCNKNIYQFEDNYMNIIRICRTCHDEIEELKESNIQLYYSCVAPSLFQFSVESIFGDIKWVSPYQIDIGGGWKLHSKRKL